jgi:hypothetical protein
MTRKCDPQRWVCMQINAMQVAIAGELEINNQQGNL